MSTYLKNMGGYKHNQLKSKSYEEIQKMFNNEMRRVNTFIPMDSEAECECEKAKGSRKKMLGRKRAGKEQQQESSKRQRIEDDKETDEHEEVKEDDEAELKKHLVIVKDDEIIIDAIPLATKPPVIVEYKLLKKGIMVHYQLIRADGSSKRYSSMIRMLQDIDREDLETLWKLVKTKHDDTRPEDEHESMLLGDLKVMFEPDIRSEVWKNLQGYTLNVWKLNLKIQKMNIKFRGGLLGLKRLQGFLELLLLSFAGTKVNADGLQLLEDYYCQEDKYGLRDKDCWRTRILMSIPITAKEKTNKKNDVKARSLLLMALPNEHQLTFSQYTDAKTMFVAIETRFRESLDSIFNRLQKIVKKSVGANSGAQNLAFMTASSTSSTNDINTAIPAYKVSTASPNVNTANPQQIHEDDLEAIDLKWQLSLLSMRAKRYYQRTGKKIFINANDTAGYDKSKVECFNCHKMGYFTREYRVPRNKEGQFRNQDNTRKQGNNEDTSSKAMLAIDGVCFNWSDMAEEQVQTNMALMAFSDSKGKPQQDDT
ncbi:hypothetical protein Tco_1144669 [Tanacetum coccineum]